MPMSRLRSIDASQANVLCIANSLLANSVISREKPPVDTVIAQKGYMGLCS